MGVLLLGITDSGALWAFADCGWPAPNVKGLIFFSKALCTVIEGVIGTLYVHSVGAAATHVCIQKVQMGVYLQLWSFYVFDVSLCERNIENISMYIHDIAKLLWRRDHES